MSIEDKRQEQCRDALRFVELFLALGAYGRSALRF